ncbi:MULTISPECIES: aminotransferase class I/II-fold pyridoxal phosphate-dependent enzyme [unclassified Carboxylicivirga]|uniref:aminotransferase class I/II-fold pyridoxal phosphate-dependent enzyme n=1 Tax=Carboxylicivirga TaxID=1628153 RepID=UPI003D33BD41
MANSKERIYLSSPHMSGHEQKYIQAAFAQNWIAPLGPNVDAFEQSLAQYCGVNHAAVLSSGTAAIHLALIMLGVRQGDEVLVSTFTFSASVNPIIYQGAQPVFIDSENVTWNMDPELLEQALADRKAKNSLERVKAIIVVHLYGMPAQMDRIMDVADRYGVPVVEDAAESLGSKYKGKALGSFGKIGILSFNGNKIITTSGGGALLCNEEPYAEKARFLATQARDPAPHYQHSELGYNYRMSNVLAGIGLGQMEILDERVRQKRAIYLFYKENLSREQCLTFLAEPDGSFFSNRWLTTILIDEQKYKLSRGQIQQHLEKMNVETRPLWKPMHRQPIFKDYDCYISGVSDCLFQHGLCLPSGTNMAESEKQHVLVEILKVLQR